MREFAWDRQDNTGIVSKKLAANEIPIMARTAVETDSWAAEPRPAPTVILSLCKEADENYFLVLDRMLIETGAERENRTDEIRPNYAISRDCKLELQTERGSMKTGNVARD